jgi:hypothetical protein
MRRDQLEHAIRTACQIIDRSEVIVVGSQAILGTFREEALPADATMSVEVDILPIANSNEETARLADLIEGVAGEFSTSECPPGSVARSVGESAERQHGSAGWAAAVHRLVSGQGRSLCCEALRVQGEGSQLRCSAAGGRIRRCGRDPRAASQRRGKTPARCRPCCGVVGVMERSGLISRTGVVRWCFLCAL